MTPVYHPRPERWPQWRFSLRTFFVVLTIFGVWLGVQVKWIHDRHEALELEWVCPGAYVDVDYRPAPWSIRLVEPGVPYISIDPDVAQDPEKVSELKKLFPEAIVETPADGLPLQDPSHSQGFMLKRL